MRHLLQCWHDMANRVKAAKRILLFLDYDGTLTPIAARPDLAAVSPEARQVLKEMSHKGKFRLAIISGRSLDDIKMVIGLENIAYTGNHGLEIECPPHYCRRPSTEAVTFLHPIAGQFKPAVERLEQKLRERLVDIDGPVIENKGLSLSLHYRLARRAAGRTIERLLLEAIEDTGIGRSSKVTKGKKVFEVRPLVDWNKGRAIEWLMEMYHAQPSLPIFAGDDITDEDGFRVLRRTGGISVFIGSPASSTIADYYMDSPDQLYEWLRLLLQETR